MAIPRGATVGQRAMALGLSWKELGRQVGYSHTTVLRMADMRVVDLVLAKTGSGVQPDMAKRRALQRVLIGHVHTPSTIAEVDEVDPIDTREFRARFREEVRSWGRTGWWS